MKPLTLSLLIVASALSGYAQTIEKNIGSFRKVIASPKINLVMVAGESESIKINYSNIDASKINIVVKNNALHIYLDGSKYTEKRERVKKAGWVDKMSVYRHASITAYVTYRRLDKLVVRGEQEVEVQSAIDSKKFKLSAYGESDITLASVKAYKFKACLYGQHTVKVKAGEVDFQKYKLFGENKIDTEALQGEEIASTTYGESKLKFNANESLRLVTIGESNVKVLGRPDVNKFTLGEVAVNR
jgi:hypothetical protein